MKLIASFLLLCFLSLNALAENEQRWYSVEVIVFANTSNAGVQEERWPEDPGLPDNSNAISLVNRSGIDSPSSTISEEVFLPGQPVEFQETSLKTLADSLKIMQRSSRYRILHATAWHMPGLPLSSSLPVRINAGKRYLEDGQSAPPLPGKTEGPAINRDSYVNQQILQDDTIAPVDNIMHELDGRIRISLTKFLDVDTDLVYRAPVTLPDTLGGITEQLQAFRLKEFRRMKSNTIHYLDHPMFGLVIAIDRYELPELPGIAPGAEPTAGPVTVPDRQLTQTTSE